MPPRVITLDAASVDGRVDWFDPDLSLYYGLVSEWAVDTHLVESATLASDTGIIDSLPVHEDRASAPLLAVPDSRGRVRCWEELLDASFWDGGVALCTDATPDDYFDYLDEIDVDCIILDTTQIKPNDAVDALADEYGAESVLVDASADTHGALLRDGLVDEVNVLVHPHVVGGTATHSLFSGPDPETPADVADLSLRHADRLHDDVLWLRYEVE